MDHADWMAAVVLLLTRESGVAPVDMQVDRLTEIYRPAYERGLSPAQAIDEALGRPPAAGRE